jgi:hypothetical protein
LDDINLDPFMPDDKKEHPKTMQFYGEKRQLHNWYNSIDDILEFMRANPNLNYRYFIEPQ